jgi:hypothetical protein
MNPCFLHGTVITSDRRGYTRLQLRLDLHQQHWILLSWLGCKNEWVCSANDRLISWAKRRPLEEISTFGEITGCPKTITSKLLQGKQDPEFVVWANCFFLRTKRGMRSWWKRYATDMMLSGFWNRNSPQTPVTISLPGTMRNLVFSRWKVHIGWLIT